MGVVLERIARLGDLYDGGADDAAVAGAGAAGGLG